LRSLKALDFDNSFSTTDLDEVLQSKMIFSNMSKGIAANKGELKKCFGTTDEDKIILMVTKLELSFTKSNA